MSRTFKFQIDTQIYTTHNIKLDIHFRVDTKLSHTDKLTLTKKHGCVKFNNLIRYNSDGSIYLNNIVAFRQYPDNLNFIIKGSIPLHHCCQKTISLIGNQAYNDLLLSTISEIVVMLISNSASNGTQTFTDIMHTTSIHDTQYKRHLHSLIQYMSSNTYSNLYEKLEYLRKYLE